MVANGLGEASGDVYVGRGQVNDEEYMTILYEIADGKR